MKNELLKCTNYFLLNKEGFTFRMNESGELENPTDGFIVSITPLINISVDINTVISYVLKEKKMNINGKSFDLYVGGWYEEKCDEFIVDISVRTTDKIEAIKIGEMTKQRAIYDLYENRTLYI